MSATVTVIGVLLTVSLWVYVMQLLLFRDALLRRLEPVERPTRMREPKVSVLKPLAGLDAELRENLESFVGQRDVTYELLFGVSDPDDPALDVVAELLAAHPDLPARVFVTDPDAGLNPKVAQLVGLEAHAEGEVIVVNDSNTRVSPDYLRNLLDELCEPGVALVSSLLVATREQSFGSSIHNLLIATHQAAGVVGGWELTGGGGLAITVGKSVGIWREVLDQLGGFHAFRDILAEDMAIGRRCQSLGYRLGLSYDLIEDVHVHGTIWETIQCHARWATTRRSLVPLNYLIELLVVPFCFALLAAIVAPTWITLTWLAGVSLLHVVGSQLFVRYLRGEALPLSRWWLELPRMAVYLYCWVQGWFRNHVMWRGHALQLGAGGVLTPRGSLGPSQLRLVTVGEAFVVRDITATLRAQQPIPHP